jgi:glutamine cyclotransferase
MGPMWKRSTVITTAIAIALFAAGAVRAVTVVAPTVVAVHPHDTGAFTEGLLFHDGVLFESSGLPGLSTVRRVDPATGSVLLQISIPPAEFGEGLALAGDRLMLLTLRDQVGHIYDPTSLADLGTFTYAGEGWGLSFDGLRLVMSNGSSFLSFRDPVSFDEIGTVEVTRDGVPVAALNELECVGDLVYANVYESDSILRIDPATGVVLTEIDASGLLTPPERQSAGCLNGIAFDPVTRHFFLTGKYWPKVFEVTFPFDPYGEPACDPAALAPAAGVRCVKDGAGGVVLSWEPDPAARSYHVNAVGAPADLAGAGPHRSDVVGGMGKPRCDAFRGAVSCTDAGALSDSPPLVFYRVFSACGPLGIDEGP